MNIDWKFVVATVATIAGILVPVWLWQADLSAQSLSVRLASSVALQPTETTSVPDIQISIGGVNIKSPFLSTLVLWNDGSKPILASDFELPIELRVGQGMQIVRSSISSVEPNNLKAEIDTDKQSVKLRPLLLNPEDTLTIAIITSGGQPNFEALARIAGISKIKFEDTTAKKDSWRMVKNLLTALIAFSLYWVYGAAFTRPNSVRLGRGLAIITMLVCGLASSLAIRKSLEAVNVDIVKLDRWPVLAAVLIIGLPVFFYTLRRSRR